MSRFTDLRRHLLPILAAASLLLLPTLVTVAQESAEDDAETEAAEARDDQTAAADENGDGEPYANTLKWTTASEVENFGYDVYRATSEDGPFERITEQPIPGAGTTDEPTAYEWADDTIDPHTQYWYYVESISMSNERERFTPIFPAPPKLPPEDEADSSEDDEEETETAESDG